jgi:hypothetical protein
MDRLTHYFVSQKLGAWMIASPFVDACASKGLF